jgi:signal peptidase
VDATQGTEQSGAGLPRRLLGGVLNILWLVGAVGAGVLLWPSSLGGCTTLTIVSGESMEPTYYTGDLVVSRCGPVDVGDVIVYSPPGIDGARVIHRIVDGTADGWIVQGDNNSFLDPWTPTQENIYGSAVVHLPQVGKVASILLSPLTWISLLVVALAVVIWPTKQDEPPQDEDERSGGTPDPDGTSDAADPDAQPAPAAGGLQELLVGAGSGSEQPRSRSPPAHSAFRAARRQ